MSLLRRVERRDLSSFGGWSPYLDGRIPPPGAEGGSTAGQIVSERTSLGLIDVYACVALIADAVSMLPIDVFRKSADFRTPVEPVPTLIRQPDPNVEPETFWAQATTSLKLRGNAYAVIVSRDRLGYPTAVELQHPDDVNPRFRRGTREREYLMRGGGIIPQSEMIHIPWVPLPGQPAALSPIEAARRGLGLAIATEEFGANWFSGGAVPSSTLETDQNVPDIEIKKTMARWIATHGGRRRPAFLSGGLKWRQISVAPNESQFIETQRLNTAKIARIFRVPPHMIGDVERSTSWGTGIEEQGIGFVVFTLGPTLTRLEWAFTRALPRPQYMKFNVAALLRGNTRDRFAAYAVARQWGWLSVNDIRRLEDLPPLSAEEGDVYLQPMNYIDAGEALKQLLAPKNPGGGQ